MYFKLLLRYTDVVAVFENPNLLGLSIISEMELLSTFFIIGKLLIK